MAELLLGAGFTVLGGALLLMWSSDRSGHGEVAFLFLGAITILPVGVALVLGGASLRKGWPHSAWWQLLVPTAIVATAMWFAWMLP